MTLLGKLLVFATVALSFLMLSWAAALYTNRIDWSANPPKEGNPEGVMVGRKKRVETAYVALGVADARWRDALRGSDAKENPHYGLLAWEQQRPANRVLYAQALQALQSGPGGDKTKPVARIKTTEDGRPVVDPRTGLPELVPAERRKAKAEDKGEPLFCAQFYVDRLADLTQQIQTQQDKYQKAVKEEAALQEQIIGPKGLRQRIIDEQTKNKRVDEELKDLAGRKTNSLVDTELLLARRAQLERRIEELKNVRKE
jgi:hypothetical protein